MKITKISILIVYLAIVAIAFFSCQDSESSADVNQDRIFIIYDLVYNGNKDVTYARATFRFGNDQGTLLNLASPSQVTFNGDLLTKTIEPVTNFTFYEKEYAGFVSSGTFKWSDINNLEFVNDISMKTIDYQDSITAIYMNNSYDFFWKGDALTENEKAVLTVNNVDTVAFEAQIFIQNDLNSKSIVLNKDKLQKLIKGNGELLMERIYTPALKEATSAGGILRSTYRPENISVMIR